MSRAGNPNAQHHHVKKHIYRKESTQYEPIIPTLLPTSRRDRRQELDPRLAIHRGAAFRACGNPLFHWL